MRNETKEKVMQAVFMLSALTSVLAVGLICFFLFAGGLPAIGKIGVRAFLLGREWAPNDTPPAFGILPMILGSVYVTLGAILVGVPIGVLTAVFLARLCPKAIYHLVKPAVDLLAGIPSVVYGFFGLVVIVPWIRSILEQHFGSVVVARPDDPANGGGRHGERPACGAGRALRRGRRARRGS